MVERVTPIDFDEIQALIRMTQRSEPIVASIATACLAVVESRRDAEVRAVTAESSLEVSEGKIAAVRHLVMTHDGNADEVIQQIALLLT